MYKTINGWTKAKMIEQIKLKNNGERSVERFSNGDILPSCRYRGTNDNACAVGCFIPDTLYVESMEYRGTIELLRKFSTLKEHMPLSENAMEMLQILHDRASDHEDVRDRMINWININVTDEETA
jgi:hypothetical protein